MVTEIVFTTVLFPVNKLFFQNESFDLSGFDLAFQKWFVSFPNENNRQTDIKCWPP